MKVLNIEVDPELRNHWLDWVVPNPQPFFVTQDEADSLGISTTRTLSQAELIDTYHEWALTEDLLVAEITEQEFLAMSVERRTALIDLQSRHNRGEIQSKAAWWDAVHRDVRMMIEKQSDSEYFVWWPSIVEVMDRTEQDKVVYNTVDDGMCASRHHEVDETTWESAEETLPAARRISGTFAPRSGPNCFGTVATAAGAPYSSMLGTADFEDWLNENCTPGGEVDEPGTVFVWRERDDTPLHAAVTLGDGWVLHKPARAWQAPRKVVTVSEVVGSMRGTGERVALYQLAS